uniref:Laminin EGF-like domain-containing protein n=1 Tax=Meloidogyne floridensis TaxID=298350 RepID=A0A915NXS8_9BILA
MKNKIFQINWPIILFIFQIFLSANPLWNSSAKPDTPNAQRPCLPNFDGRLCEKCAPGFKNISAGCLDCDCNPIGSTSGDCNFTTGQCHCKSSFGDIKCDKCANGYYKSKETNGEVCDESNGQCYCKLGFTGRGCDKYKTKN